MKAWLAVPGDIATPTGGYGYARRLLAEAPAAGLDLRLLPLPGGFPEPSEAEVSAATEALAAANAPVIVDGLALSAMPPERLPEAPPLVALLHHPRGLEPEHAPDLARRLLAAEAAALARVRGVIVTSRTTAEAAVAELGVPAERVAVAPPGLDPAPRSPCVGRPPRILCLGSVTPRKGQDVLVDALSRLVEAEWTCRLVGPADRDARYAAKVRGRIDASGLAGRVELTGALQGKALEAEWERTDIFCLPTFYEGYGMALVEAMARGLPVVAGRGGATPEVAPPGAAVLVPPGDTEALADVLALLLATPAARRRLGDAAHAHAATLPGWSDTARLVAEALRKFVG